MLILPKLHCLLFLKLKNIELRFHFLYSHQCVYKFDNLYQFSLSSWCGLMVPISVFIYLTTFTSSAHPFEVVWLCWVVQFIITHHVNFTSQVGMCCVNIVMFKLSPRVIHTCVMTPTSSHPSSIVTKHAQSHPCTYAPSLWHSDWIDNNMCVCVRLEEQISGATFMLEWSLWKGQLKHLY